MKTKEQIRQITGQTIVELAENKFSNTICSACFVLLMHKLRNVSEAELIGRYVAFPSDIESINVKLETYGIDLEEEVNDENRPILESILKDYRFPENGLVLSL
jgi:flagellar hook assembly protein FlgD